MSETCIAKPPSVAVLLATFNGIPFLDAQLISCLNQSGVSCTFFVSDDFSSDGTWEALKQLDLDNVILLTREKRHGRASGNFFRLLRDVNFSDFDYVAFCDQDDVWEPGKLARAIGIIEHTGVDIVSSSVIAFWPDGRERLLRKDQRLRLWDHLFESAGPGCTYVMRSPVASAFAAILKKEQNKAEGVALHDWLLYAWARHDGYKWFIDGCPMTRYRQHGNNEFGANSGLRAIYCRFLRLTDGWYRDQVLLMADIIGASDVWPIKRLLRFNVIDRLVLSLTTPFFRRRVRDQILLTICFPLLRKKSVKEEI